MNLQEANAEILSAGKGNEEGQGNNATPASPAGEQQGQDEGVVSPATSTGDGGTPKNTDTTNTTDTGREKPLPYDQDPKWKKARAAEAALESLLEKHGFESIEELTDKLETGLQLRDIIGDRDAAELVERANRLAQYEEYWAQQKALKQEESETPEETIARLKREKEEILKAQQAEKSSKAERENAMRAIQEFSKLAEASIKTAQLEGEAAELARLVLALDNPVVELEDITDKKSVKTATEQTLTRFKNLIDKIKQSAIDSYVKEKGAVPVLPRSDAAAINTNLTGVDTSKLSPQEKLGRANAEILKILLQAKDMMGGV